MKRVYSLIIFLVLFLFSFGKETIIAADFSTDYDISYVISPTGNTIVTQNILLTNNQTRLYPKQYTIKIDTEDIKNVIAYDKKGVIKPQILQHDGKTELTLSFNEQVVGIGKQLSFTLRYEQGDIAIKNGNIWDVNIPGIEDDPNIRSYVVSLQTPPTFGTNAYLKPASNHNRTWTKEVMITGGISAAYGDNQEFTVLSSYDLENDAMTPVSTEITIPPDTAFQKVTLVSLDPKPISMRVDDDGNWLALYELAGKQKQTVKAVLNVITYIHPRSDYTKVSSSDMEPLLLPQQYWEVHDPQIIELAKKYTTPKEIYDYVVSSLTYDYQKTNTPFARKGAKETLKTPQSSICSEFTDLFVALSRAAGIPAREVVGYAYTNNAKLRPLSTNSDILHAWPEYYDEKQNLWIPVDPTWEKTTKGVDYFSTLDFNHIAFAIHGRSSELPYPAGSYKQGSTPKKNIVVNFSKTKQTALPHTIKSSLEIPPVITIGSVFNGIANIQNTSPTAIDSLRVVIESDPFPITIIKNETNIPPYGLVSIPFTIKTKGIIPFSKGKITITANDEISSFFYDMKPMYWLLIPIAMMTIGILILVWTFSKKR